MVSEIHRWLCPGGFIEGDRVQVKRPDLEEAAAGVVSFVLLTTDFVWVRLYGTGQNACVCRSAGS